MATMPIVNPMPPFDPDSDIGANIGPKWKIWMEDFEMYITANGITDKAKKRALLLYQAGVVYSSFQWQNIYALYCQHDIMYTYKAYVIVNLHN